MYNTNEFVRRTFYSLELKHQICKDHIENGLSLRECVDKYNLSCHLLVHDWLRQLGYIAGVNQRTRSAYIGIEIFFLREYDLQIGRFGGVDILSEKMVGMSVYQYGANNPITFNDPNGDKLCGRCMSFGSINYASYSNQGSFNFADEFNDDWEALGGGRGRGGGGSNSRSYENNDEGSATAIDGGFKFTKNIAHLPGGCPHPTFPELYYLSFICRMYLNIQVKEKVIKHLMKFTSANDGVPAL